MIATALTFSCQKAELGNTDVADNGNNEVVDFVPGPGRILAVSPTGPDTKVAFGKENEDGSLPVVWTEGDSLRVYSENHLDGEMYKLVEGASGSSAVFTGTPVNGEKRYAVFPFTRAKSMKDTEGKIVVSFGALQSKQYFHSSLKNNNNNLQFMPMWAKETEDGVFEFKSLCGAVMFNFNDYQELRSMKITGVTITSENNYISGWATVDPETEELTLHGTEPKQKTISVNYATGWSIMNANSNPSINDNGTDGFIIALPAMTYPANDLTVTFTDSYGRVFKKVVTKELVVAPGQLRKFPTLPFTFAYGEANSVVVAPNKTVSFDAALRYTLDKNLSVDNMAKAEYAAEGAYFEEGVSIEVLWEIAASAQTKDVSGEVISSATLNEDKIKVTANSTGNALVALKDKDGVILWSWHIWVSEFNDQKYTNLSAQGSPTFMDRNLGATSADPTDNMNTVGLYYQYGRKDPFVISKNFTPILNSPYFNHDVELTFYEKRTSTTARMAWTIKNPTTRIVYEKDYDSSLNLWNRAFNDWLMPTGEVDKNWGCASDKFDTEEKISTLKGEVKTIYDPCPKGYKVPEYHYYSGIVKGENGNATYANGGWKVDFDESDEFAYYPLAGTLNSGTLTQSGFTKAKGGLLLYNTRGMYWTTTLAKIKVNNTTYYGAIGTFYNSSNVHHGAYQSRIMNFPTAANIRCMKIPTTSAE